MRKRRRSLELLAQLLPRGLFLRLYGFAKTGTWPNLRDPRRFSERMLRRMLDPGDELAIMARTGDKYTMRAHVEERLGPGYLPRLHDVIEVGQHVTAERVAAWPERGVLKASHASRWMTFVERASADPAELDALVQRWLRRSYAAVRQEPHYGVMTPRAVLEEDLSRAGEPPSDVKIFVIEGVPRLIMVDSSRFRGLRRFVADPEWRPLSVSQGDPPPASDPPPPATLAQMREVASALAKGITFVRVDLYEIDGRVLVGEMTHFPRAGVLLFKPRSFDDELGAVWGERRAVNPRWLRRDGTVEPTAAHPT